MMFVSLAKLRAAEDLQGVLANRDGRISSRLANHPIGESAMCTLVGRVSVSVGKSLRTMHTLAEIY